MELVARNPYQLQKAHEQMVSWCDRKIADCEAEAKETEASLAIARERKWRCRPFEAKLNLQAKRVQFYQKIKKALELGYYIVPNFDCSIFAIRSTRKNARGGVEYTSSWTARHVREQRLPAGAGEYIGPEAKIEQRTDKEKGTDGKERNVNYYWPTEFKEVEFPFDLAKPEIMSPVAQAMATKIFDEIGVARDTRRYGDPMILAVIRNPRQTRPSATFFITWAFNPDVL